MQTIEIEQTFDFPLEKLIEARVARYHHKKLWPEIEDSKIVDNKKIGNKVIEKRITRVSIAKNSPINRILKYNSVEIVENTIFDSDEKIYTLETKLKNPSLLIDITEKTVHREFDENGKIKNKRIIKIFATVRIPLLGIMIEKALLNEFAKRSAEDEKRILEFYQTNLEKKD